MTFGKQQICDIRKAERKLRVLMIACYVIVMLARNVANAFPLYSDARLSGATTRSTLQLGKVHKKYTKFYTGSMRGESRLFTSEQSSSEEENRLLEMASKLRKEAELMEKEIQAKRSTETAKSTIDTVSEPRYSQLEDSCWTIVYRFSSQPKDDDENDSKTQSVLPNYSGKLTIKLRDDGYSDIVRHEPSGSLGTVEIQKVWGWDKENSQEDDKDYLLFSMDVTLPKTDPKVPSGTDRYYLQARVDTESNGISLKDGTVTVKKDVSEKTRGVWGLFSVAGILTEFRYVGDFAARPSSDA